MYHNLVLDQMFDTNPLLQTTNLFTGPISRLRTILAYPWYVILDFLFFFLLIKELMESQSHR